MDKPPIFPVSLILPLSSVSQSLQDSNLPLADNLRMNVGNRQAECRRAGGLFRTLLAHKREVSGFRTAVVMEDRHPCKSSVKGKHWSSGALGRARIFRARTSARICLSAVVPAFAEPDIHSLSRAQRPSQKIECVFSASPETVRREPREFHLRCSVGQWRDLAVCALCDPDVLFLSLAWFSGPASSSAVF